MSDEKVWFITGAARGMGTNIAREALAAGHAVVATGRNTDALTTAVGEHEDLLVVPLVIADTGHFIAEESPDELLAALNPLLAPYRDGTAAATSLGTLTSA